VVYTTLLIPKEASVVTQTHEEPRDAYDEDDGWFIGEYPAVMFEPKHKPAQEQAHEKPTEARIPSNNGSVANEASNAGEASTAQPQTDRSRRSAGHRRSRNHLQDLQWITAIWAMGLSTIVVLAGVLMWCYTGGTIDLNPYLHSGITTGTALAIGAVVVLAFKNVVDDKKKKEKRTTTTKKKKKKDDDDS
jgi:hypothetical protein